MYNSRRRALVWLIAGVGWTAAVAPLSAQVADLPASGMEYYAPAEPHAEAKADKVLRAFRVAGAPPEIDGRLDDPVWASAELIDDLIQVEPDNLAEPSQRTEAQIAYDDRYLYVAIRSFDTNPEAIVTGLGRRDSPPPTDRILLSFDPRHDHLTAYIFEVNPDGVQSDRVFFNDTQQNNDYSGVWDVGTLVTDEGWNAEYRIPFSQMQFDLPAGEEVVWGFTMRRDIQRRGEIIRWVGLPRDQVGFVSLFGHLVFEERMDPPRRVEFQPFLFGRRQDLLGAASAYDMNGGLDLRVGLGTFATLSGTVNPDFGQVEQDPAVLNLTVFETFFPERRPFFLEDSGTFRLPYSQFPLFHSRRIGQRPGRIPLEEGDELVDRPDQTTILTAGKVTGKASNWTYGVLSALTDREYAIVDAPVAGGSGEMRRTRRLIEPLASYNVLRAQRDIWGGTSNVGAIATGVVRDADANAFTGGVDYTLRWGQNLYELNGHWVGTNAPLPEGQRSGFGGATNFSYFGRHVGVDAHFDYFSPTFRNTDLGFKQGRVDQVATEAIVFLREREPWGVSRFVQVGLGARHKNTTGGLAIERQVGLSLNLNTTSFWNFSVFGERFFEAYDDLDTRGGPPILTPARNAVSVFASTDSRRTWQVGLSLNGSDDAEGSWSTRIGPFVRLQPSGRLQTSLNLNYTTARDDAQWVTNEDVTGDGETDHIYGSLRRHVLDVTGRLTYAFHRDMTLEVFLQPFVAVGDYSSLRRLARPRSYEFEPAEISFDPDFNRKSLRANVILRWEYIRGSTLFLVWNASSVDRSRPGEFDAFRDLGDSFGSDGDHVFMAKVSYWLGL